MATYQIPFNSSGSLEVADDVSPWYICSAPYGLTMLGVDLAIKTPAQGASIIIDIEKSTDGVTWEGIFSVPFIYGIHDGPNNASTLTDASASFTDSLVGLTIDNNSDHSMGLISAVNSATNLSVTLAGGTDNDWDTGNTYTIAIGGGILPGEYIGAGGTPTVTELSQGELLRLDIEQCGVSGDPGVDLSVSLRVRQ